MTAVLRRYESRTLGIDFPAEKGSYIFQQLANRLVGTLWGCVVTFDFFPGDRWQTIWEREQENTGDNSGLYAVGITVSDVTSFVLSEKKLAQKEVD